LLIQFNTLDGHDGPRRLCDPRLHGLATLAAAREQIF
jgi:hypothetical protein